MGSLSLLIGTENITRCKMKIALCLSGQPRSYQKGYEYHKRNLLDLHDVDVYIFSHAELDQGIQDLYKPYKCVYEPLDTTGVNEKYTNTANFFKHPPVATMSMYSSMYKCSQLIDQQYDWVIRSRTDWALADPIPFEDLDPSMIYIPEKGTDQFAWGGQDVMMKYMSTFVNMDLYYDQGTVYNGENMLYANLDHLSIRDLVKVHSLTLPFPPGPYNGTPHALIRDDHYQWKQY
jgi:hypothetical protein